MNRDNALQTIRSRFDEFERSLNGESATAFHGKRTAALERFMDMGFPTQRDEEWRFTSVQSVTEADFALHPRPEDALLNDIDAAGFLPGVDTAARLVFVNGHYIEQLSQGTGEQGGLTVRPFSQVLEAADAAAITDAGVDDSDENPFALLNLAFAVEGAVIHVRRGTAVERPVHLLFVSAGEEAGTAHPRVSVHLEHGAELTIVEQHDGRSQAGYVRNIVWNNVVEQGAILRHYKLQDEGPEARHIASTYARVAKDAQYENHYFGFGAALLRNNLHGVLAEEHAELTMNGLYAPYGDQHMDHHSVIDHAEPNCNSHELYKGVLRDRSRGVFSGKIIVRKDAQKTDAKQSNNNLLLSEDAQVDSKPQLEIWADDVKCTHGATIGRIDEEALFYLQSRGIGREQAHSMLSHAFASELIAHVKLPALRELLDALLHERLERNGISA